MKHPHVFKRQAASGHRYEVAEMLEGNAKKALDSKLTKEEQTQFTVPLLPTEQAAMRIFRSPKQLSLPKEAQAVFHALGLN